MQDFSRPGPTIILWQRNRKEQEGRHREGGGREQVRDGRAERAARRRQIQPEDEEAGGEGEGMADRVAPEVQVSDEESDRGDEEILSDSEEEQVPDREPEPVRARPRARQVPRADVGADLPPWALAMVEAQTRILANMRMADNVDVEARRRVDRDADRLERERRERETNSRRRQERGLHNLRVYQEGDDLEEYVWLLEDAMRACQLPDDEWLMTLAQKMSGSKARILRDIRKDGGEYEETRDRFLSITGYSSEKAAVGFFGSRWEELRKLDASTIISQGKRGLERIVAPEVIPRRLESALLKAWVYHMVPSRGRQLMDERVVDTTGTLTRTLEDYLRIEESGRTTDRRSVRKYEGEKDRNKDWEGQVTCYKCGERGHRAGQCTRVEKRTWDQKVKCYKCGKEGHIRPNCPVKNEVKAEAPKAVNVKGAKRAKEFLAETDVVLEGQVGEQRASFLLDSGASITIVPSCLVPEDCLDGGDTKVLPYGAKIPLDLPTAKVHITVAGQGWEERVAVASLDKCESVDQVLYSLNLRSQRGLRLVEIANRPEHEVQTVCQVVTRSRAKEEIAQETLVQETEEREQPVVSAAIEGTPQVGSHESPESEKAGQPGGGAAIEGPPQGGLAGSRLDTTSLRVGEIGCKYSGTCCDRGWVARGHS